MVVAVFFFLFPGWKRNGHGQVMLARIKGWSWLLGLSTSCADHRVRKYGSGLNFHGTTLYKSYHCKGYGPFSFFLWFQLQRYCLSSLEKCYSMALLHGFMCYDVAVVLAWGLVTWMHLLAWISFDYVSCDYVKIFLGPSVNCGEFSGVNPL